MKHMSKKLAAFLFLTLGLLLFLVPLLSAGAQETGVFRLHIIANSDAEEDQRVKLLVRDALLAYEKESMRALESGEEAKRLVLHDGQGLLNAAETALKESGAGYGAQLYVGEFAFPSRDYLGKTYPAGDYEALRVVLGKGEGKNWWCVMFPPLCILELEGGKLDTEGLQMNSLLLKLIKEADGGKLWKKIAEALKIELR